MSYFPSYEIVMDELRDYRWYTEDMLHPSAPATSYITERLLEAHFDQTDDALRESISALRTAARHRHARPSSEAARAFAASQLQRLRELCAECEHLADGAVLREEAEHFEQMAREPQAEPK